jgi:hypothetical protein
MTCRVIDAPRAAPQGVVLAAATLAVAAVPVAFGTAQLRLAARL